MSTNRIHTSSSLNGSANAFLINSDEQKQMARKNGIFRAPKSLQEKCLSLIICFLLLAVAVFLISLWIVSDRWKATLSQLKDFYVAEDHVCDTDACKETAEGLISNIDPSTDPCDDFYQYACGGWMENNPISEGGGAVMAHFRRLYDMKAIIKDLIKNESKYPSKSESICKARKFFHACMNDKARDKLGVKPLLDVVKEFGGWPMLGDDEWSEDNYVWYQHVPNANRKLLLNIIAEVFLELKFEDNTKQVLSILSGTILFGDEVEHDYEDKNRTADARDFIREVALLMGSTLDNETLDNQAVEIVGAEYLLFNLSRIGLPYVRNVIPTNIGTLEANSLDKTFSYKDFINQHLRSNVLAENDTLLYMDQPIYFYHVPFLLQKLKKRVLANYIAFHIVFSFMSFTTPQLRKLKYLYRSGFDYSGIEESICIGTTKSYFTLAVGRLYVDHFFPNQTRSHVTKMVEMIRLAYSSTLDQNLWMDERTQLYAAVKLQSIQEMIGHQNWLLNDTLLDENFAKIKPVTEDNFFQTIMMVVAEEGADRYSRWNKTANRDDSEMYVHNPIEINAFYVSSTNFISLPSGILGYPYYKYGRIDSINYGAIGTVIGHEISHAFDTDGRLYDHKGNRRNWWTNETKQSYLKKAACFADQYTEYKDPGSDLKVDGVLTLGENIADNEGVRNSFKAFRLHLALSDEGFNYRKKLPGLEASPEQLFFLGYASIWCSNMTNEFFNDFAKYDVHSPNRIRVNIPLANFKEFARAFHCSPGTPMNPKNKCVLW